MAEFKFSCPQCGQHIACDTGYAGMQINCPTCQQLIVVPQSPQAPRMAAAPPTPPSAPSRLATQRPTATPAPASTPGRAPFTPPGIQKKTSALKTVLVITAIIVVLAALGGGGWKFYSNHKEKAEAAMGNPAAQVPVPTATAASGAMDILGKVHGAYTNLTSLSVSGTSVMVIDLSQIKPADIQAAESAGGRTNKAPRKIPKLPKSQTVTTDVSIKLARPDLYRVVENINTAMGRFTNKFTIAAWSAEKGDYTLFGKNYSKAGDRDSAFRAIGSSGGLATAIAQLFYGEESQMGKFITDWGQTDDDSLDGEDCYTLTAKMFGQKLKMWVDKSSYMILQSQVTLGGAISDADLNAAMDTFDTKTNLTQAQIDRMKAQTKQQAMMMTKIKGTVTETYDDIETNQTYSADEFDYTLPANAKLTPSQF